MNMGKKCLNFMFAKDNIYEFQKTKEKDNN